MDSKRESVLSSTNNDKDEIKSAILKSVTDNNYISSLKSIKNPYGDGNSSSKIADVLRSIELNDKLIYKNITY